jgi:hypothetical protein
MKIYTLENGHILEGAKVISYHLRSGDVTIPAITVGEEGRGRKVGVLPIQLNNSYQQWKTEGHCWVYHAQLGQTKTGRPKLIELQAPETKSTQEAIICVFRTQIGFRGGNAHTGDRLGWFCHNCGEVGLEVDPPKTCPNGHPVNLWFAEFPAEAILVEGVIAQGEAGAMGSGKQIVAVMPANKVFRTGYSGRLYGAPAAHYYLWDGENLKVATWEERQVAELF